MPHARWNAIALAATLAVTSVPSCSNSHSSEVPADKQGSPAHPVASAGAAQIVLKGQQVTLDGTASTSSRGGALAFRWTQVGGASVALGDASAARPTFTAPRVAGTLTFALVVTEGEVASLPARAEVAVQNRAPVADAGPDLAVEAGWVVTLYPGRSSDPDGDPLTFQWLQRSGPAVTLAQHQDGTASFVAPDPTSEIEVSLTVSDGEATATDVILVRVYGTNGNAPPRVDAGPDRSAARRGTVVLAGWAADPDGDPVTYSWEQTSGPPVALLGATTEAASFVAPAGEADLQFSLTASDGFASATDRVWVFVRNQPPSAGPVAITPSAPGTLDDLQVMASPTDPDADPLTVTYAWRRNGTYLSGQTGSTLPERFTARGDEIAAVVTASDGLVAVATETSVTIVNTPPSLGPVAITPAVPGTAADLHVSAQATDPDGDPVAVTCAWKRNGVLLPGQVGATLPASLTSRDDLFTALVSASDGVATTSAEASVTIANTPPVVTVTIGPASPGTLDDLHASALATDADADPLTLTYAWSRNGALLSAQTGATLPASITTRGDVLTVSVTASDGQASASSQASVTIRDTPPIVTSDAPAEVRHRDPVSFQLSVTDPDGDSTGTFALHHGPAGMTTTPDGRVTWTASGPMFDRSMDVHWGVSMAGTTAVALSGTIRVVDPARRYPLRRTGIQIPVWTSGLQVTDLDGDDRAEVLVAASGGLYELARSGAGYAQRWMYPFSPGDRDAIGAVVAHDVDGDGRQEIFFSAGSVLVKLDGVDRREIARLDAAGAYSCRDLKVADLDRDGHVELVCLGSTSTYTWETQARIVVIDPAALTVKWQSDVMALGTSLAIGNVDGDPALEIVTSGGYVFDGATHANTWAYGPGFGRAVGCGDLDGDGVDEIVGMADWSTVTGFSAVSRSPLWELSNFDSDALLVKDLDGDGIAEFLIGDGQWGNVTAYRYDPATQAPAKLWSINSQDHGVTSIAVGDVDGDGLPELVWGSGATSSGADVFVVAGPVGPSIAVKWINVNPEQLDGPYVGARFATTAPGSRGLLFEVPTTNSGYDGARLVRLDPATGLLEVSAEIGSNWSDAAALDVADYDHDGVDEALLATADLYAGYFAVHDLARGISEWTSAAGVGTGRAMAHGDLNGDGHDDLVAITSDGYVYAYDVTNGALLWRSASLSPGVDVAVADLDGDGALEIVALGGARLVVYGKSTSGSPAYVERASAALTGGLDLLVADCDGDLAPEVYVLAGTTVLAFDATLAPRGALTLGGNAQSLHLEDLPASRRNLLVAMMGAPSYSTGARPYLLAIDARNGSEVWRSPPLYGTVPVNSLGYFDVDGDGTREVAFGTTAGMYLTR
jgi:hypothetical protein